MAARILNFMDPDNGTTSAVLADRMHISGAKAEELLTKMERQGLVCKFANGGLRRSEAAIIHNVPQG